MTTVRRRVLRPAQLAAAVNVATQVKIQKRRAQLEKERTSLARWMARLRRAFHSVEKTQVRIGRLERELARLEQP